MAFVQFLRMWTIILCHHVICVCVLMYIWCNFPLVCECFNLLLVWMRYCKLDIQYIFYTLCILYMYGIRYHIWLTLTKEDFLKAEYQEFKTCFRNKSRTIEFLGMFKCLLFCQRQRVHNASAKYTNFFSGHVDTLTLLNWHQGKKGFSPKNGSRQISIKLKKSISKKRRGLKGSQIFYHVIARSLLPSTREKNVNGWNTFHSKKINRRHLSMMDGAQNVSFHGWQTLSKHYFR